MCGFSDVLLQGLGLCVDPRTIGPSDFRTFRLSTWNHTLKPISHSCCDILNCSNRGRAYSVWDTPRLRKTQAFHWLPTSELLVAQKDASISLATYKGTLEAQKDTSISLATYKGTLVSQKDTSISLATYKGTLEAQKDTSISLATYKGTLVSVLFSTKSSVSLTRKDLVDLIKVSIYSNICLSYFGCVLKRV